MYQLAERARRLLTQVDHYIATTGTSLNTVQDEPLDLKLQYLIEIKVVAATIVIVLAY